MKGSWIASRDLKNLPWKQWKNGGGAWIFTDEAPSKLANRIEENGGSLRIGGYIYQLRCEDKFIVRFPAKRH